MSENAEKTSKPRRMRRPTSSNITWHDPLVRSQERENKLGQRGSVVWLTGLSGSGKSTVAVTLDKTLFDRGYSSYILDGDNVRHTLNADLGFSDDDRKENIRRIYQVARLFADAGLICVTAFISPFRADREAAREAVGGDRFFEIFVDAPLDVCEERDPKGLYKKARAGEIPEFTGISSPYEAPTDPQLTLSTDKLSVEESVEAVIEMLQSCSILRRRDA